MLYVYVSSYLILMTLIVLQAIVSSSYLLFVAEGKIVIRTIYIIDKYTLIVFACILTFFLSSVQNCITTMWHLRSSFYIMKPLFEFNVIIITMPVWCVYVTLKSCNYYHFNDLFVALVYPLFSLLYLVGSSLSAYIIGTLGLIIGGWLLVSKLPTTSSAFL